MKKSPIRSVGIRRYDRRVERQNEIVKRAVSVSLLGKLVNMRNTKVERVAALLPEDRGRTQAVISVVNHIRSC